MEDIRVSDDGKRLLLIFDQPIIGTDNEMVLDYDAFGLSSVVLWLVMLIRPYRCGGTTVGRIPTRLRGDSCR